MPTVSKDTASFFSKVGRDISACNGNLACALEMADLKFNVSAEQIKDLRGNVIPRAFNIARQDNGASLGVVGARYVPTQTKDAFKYLEALPGKANFKRGGMLKEGKFFLSAEFETFSVGGDSLTAFGVFLSSFDGSWANRAVWTLERHACTNICRFLTNGNADGIGTNKGGRSAKHTTNHAVKLDGFIFEMQMRQTESVQVITKLQDTPMSERRFVEIVEKVVVGDSTRAENMRAEIRSEFCNASRGTNGVCAWDAFNAFSAYDTHLAIRRETETASADENGFDALISGRGFADRALPVILDALN